VRLPETAHAEQPWRIHEIAPEFELEDVWQVPGRSTPAAFRRFVSGFGERRPSSRSPLPVRLLFGLRRQLGRLFGWDGEESGLGGRTASLSERLPADLRGTAPAVEYEGMPFDPLYLTEDEFAAEIANVTMHGVLQFGLTGDGRVQMAILVKPNGIGGRLYMAAIKPFRLYLVYPALLRELGRELARAGEEPQGA
jgi:hypothetical protein